MIDQITVNAQRDIALWQPSIAGAFPCVPDYLAGAPTPMRRRVMQPNDRAPLSIYFDPSGGGDVSAKDLEARGIAVLALALMLNRTRAVSLKVVVGISASVGGNTGAFCVIPLGSSPLDIALSCNATTSVAFNRALCFSLMMHAPESRSPGGWEWGLNPGGYERPQYLAKWRAALGATKDDILIPPAHSSDPLVRDPLGFVKRSLAEAEKGREG